MPVYVYRCPDGHESDFCHGMMEAPVILCHCGKQMRKKPQTFLWGWSPFDRLHDNNMKKLEAKRRRDALRKKG